MGLLKEEKKSWGSGGLFGNRAFFSLVLILLCPLFALTFWYTCKEHKGSFIDMFKKVSELVKSSDFKGINDLWPNQFNPLAWKIISGYMLFEILLMKFVPGKVFKATVTPSGHIPIYNANGVQCYLITVISLIIGGYYNYIQPAIVYDMMGELLASMNFFAIFFCILLTVKGLNFPSTADSGSNGNIIVDYFWGTELYPRILGVDVKQFTNCRFGMMFWQVGLICFAFKQYELNSYLSNSILASVLIQSIYIFKFFWWETGYFCSMDIQHDRAGYYICWGCLVWVPSMYTIHTYFMVEHPVLLSWPVFTFIVVSGIASIWCNYDCDRCCE